jgi:hypothetical protein
MAKQRLAPTPLMRQGTYTAKQIMEYVLKIIEAEPKRLKMRTWTSLFKGFGYWTPKRPNQVPACGTVACLAGWITIATTGEEAHGSSRTMTILGLNDYEHVEVRGDLYKLFYQSELPRRSAIKQFRNIIKKHEQVLSTTKVEVRR